jgi:hypothetical protein
MTFAPVSGATPSRTSCRTRILWLPLLTSTQTCQMTQISFFGGKSVKNCRHELELKKITAGVERLVEYQQL